MPVNRGSLLDAFLVVAEKVCKEQDHVPSSHNSSMGINGQDSETTESLRKGKDTTSLSASQDLLFPSSSEANFKGLHLTLNKLSVSLA